ncbi:hypothetical protein DRH27_04810 [Candidatus Falkowbacteria bacterium]|nr:MAG: hypothetical protein DRH27_04810 [Candidatus Falkowbacteria bacterium]
MTAHAKKYFYEHGLPFPQDLKKEVLEPLIRDLNREPSILVLDGTSGTGKTSLAVHLADCVNEMNGQLIVDLTPQNNIQLGHGGVDLTEMSEKASEAGFIVFIFDEADFEKKGTMTKYNRNLHKFFREYRQLKILIILVIQSVSWLDNDLHDGGLIKGLIHLHDPTKNYTSYSVYDLENLSYLLDRMERLGRHKKRKAYTVVHGYKRGQFLDLSPERREQLRLLSTSFKKKTRKAIVKNLKADKT